MQRPSIDQVPQNRPPKSPIPECITASIYQSSTAAWRKPSSVKCAFPTCTLVLRRPCGFLEPSTTKYAHPPYTQHFKAYPETYAARAASMHEPNLYTRPLLWKSSQASEYMARASFICNEQQPCHATRTNVVSFLVTFVTNRDIVSYEKVMHTSSIMK